MNPLEFGTEIKRRRGEALMTQEQLAKLAGISATSLSRIEGGKQHPTLPTINALCEALDIELYLSAKFVPGSREWKFIYEKQAEEEAERFE